jgi:hypothetical protein
MLPSIRESTASLSHWASNRRTISRFTISLVLTLFCAPTLFGQALTVRMLREHPDLTPGVFMAYFRDFSFKLGDQLQDPDLFLATRTGDCDDFASLAETLLREKNFTTKLVAIFMDGQTHVVCYVQEVQGYLDYNLRGRDIPLQPSSGQLEDIADQVSAYFRTPWRSVAEFESRAGIRRFGRITFR